jgi:hypothetical protein
MLRHKAALASHTLTRGYPEGQLTHQKSLCPGTKGEKVSNGS